MSNTFLKALIIEKWKVKVVLALQWLASPSQMFCQQKNFILFHDTILSRLWSLFRQISVCNGVKEKRTRDFHQRGEIWERLQFLQTIAPNKKFCSYLIKFAGLTEIGNNCYALRHEHFAFIVQLKDFAICIFSLGKNIKESF